VRVSRKSNKKIARIDNAITMNGCHLARSRKATLVSFMEQALLAMTVILGKGMDSSKFRGIGDFGPGFYCADKVHTTLRFANASAFLVGHLADAVKGPHGAPFRAAVIYFDVTDNDLDDLKKLDLDEGDEWLRFTKHCISEGGHVDVYKVGASGRISIL